MAQEAARYNMSTGLKNSGSILSQVQDVIQFAVNEECAAMGECNVYQSFLRVKPVFHIEYTTTKSGPSMGPSLGFSSGEKSSGSTGGWASWFGGSKKGDKDKRAVDAAEEAQATEATQVDNGAIGRLCTPQNAPDLGPKFSTVIKIEALDGWVQFCDGRVSTTRIKTTDKGKWS
jgi:hypothetical protein